MTVKFPNYRVNNVFISGSILCRVYWHVPAIQLLMKLYTNSRNIKRICLEYCGLHFLDTGKKILEREF